MSKNKIDIEIFKKIKEGSCLISKSSDTNLCDKFIISSIGPFSQETKIRNINFYHTDGNLVRKGKIIYTINSDNKSEIELYSGSRAGDILYSRIDEIIL